MERGCRENGNYFFAFWTLEELSILLLGDKVNLGLNFNYVISTFIFNEVTRNFC